MTLVRDREPRVDWHTIGQPKFDRLIEALVPYQHPKGSDVRPFDGTGGDGGRDVLVTEPDGRTIIYQLKYFPEGFDGKAFNHRRAGQIEPSLEAAARHHPDEWVLVAPCNPQQTGWAYLDRLRKKYPDFAITFIGRDKLDGRAWCAGHDDIVRAQVTRSELLEVMEIIGQEQAALADPSRDLAHRARALKGLVDTVDPHYTLDFGQVGNTTFQQLRARTPQSQQLSPVTVSIEFGGPGDEVQAFQRALEYGTMEPRTLPGEAVLDFRVTGTSLMRSGPDDITKLVLAPFPDGARTQPLQLTFQDDNGTSLGMHTGQVVNVTSGTKGMTLKHVFYDLVTVTWTLPHQPGQGDGKVDLAIAPFGGADVGGVRRATRMLLDWERATRVKLSVTSTQPLALLGGSWPLEQEHRETLQILYELADDLAYVQDEIGAYFPMPESWTNLERIELRVIRRALEGRQTYDPKINNVTMTVEPTLLTSDRRASLLAGEPGVLMWTTQATSTELFGHAISSPGPTAFVFREARLEDPAAVRAGLERGLATKAKFVSADQEHLIVCMLERMTGDRAIAAEPWSLTGIEELRQLQQPGSS